MDTDTTKIEKRKEYMKKYYIKRKKLGYITVKKKPKTLKSLEIIRGEIIVRFD
tara:strand:+ start:1695 stop:1853 length:159 start_codon:yes stop_codon:yes gene_type:complete